MAFSLKKTVSNVTRPIQNVIKDPSKGNIGEAIYGINPVGRIDNAIGSPFKNLVQGTVGKSLEEPKVKATQINTSSMDLDQATKDAQVRNAGLGAAIAAQQAKIASRTTPQMQATLINPKAVQQVGSQSVGPGQSIAMDTSGVQRAQVGTGATAQTAQMDMTQQEQQRQAQLDLGQQLAAQASGEAPSVAAMQAKQQGDRALAAQLALQAGQSGSAVPLAMRTAAQQQAGIGAEIANQSAILRLQEQQAAQKAAGELATNVRGQDINVASTQAGMEQQTNIANLQAQVADMDRTLRADLANQGVDLDKAKADAANGNAMALANLSTATQNADRLLRADLANQGVNLDVLKQNAAAGNAAAAANLTANLQKMGLDDAMQRAYMQNQLDLSAAQTAQVMESIKIKSAETLGQAQLTQQANIANQQAKTQQLGGLMSAGGALGAAYLTSASDINLKKDIKKTTKSLGEFLNSLSVSDYEYKDPKWGKGKQTSVMAQELDKSEIGRKAVMNTPEGKIVDYAKLLPAMLAANVDANKRIMTLEKALKARRK